MRRQSLVVILTVIFLALIVPANVQAVIALTLAPSPQTISQTQTATYNIGIIGAANTAYTFSVSGVVGSFNPNPVMTDATGTGSTQLIADASTPPTYCPGTYSFTVTASGNGESQSIGGVLTVNQVGPPLQVSVNTDKQTYQKGETVTVTITVTRPAEGQVTVSGPSGSPMTYPFTTQSAGSGVVATFTAQATGSYTVTAQADDYCSNFSSAQSTFTVSPNTYDVTISFSGIPAQYPPSYQVDGQNQGKAQASEPTTLTFPIGSSHTVMVDQYVSGDTGVRYYCAQNSWSVSSTGSNTFNYQTQYRLSVSANPANITQVSGGGWFNSGQSAQTSQAPQIVPGLAGVQYVFQNWSVDGGAQSGNQVTITMNAPHTAVAQYKTQYQLTVNSPSGLGNPQGGGYYDSGSTAQFSVTSPVGTLIQQVFVQWQGDYTGTSAQASITMNGPKTVNAVWTTSYTNLYIVGGVVAAVVVIAAALGMSRRSKGATKEPKKEEEEGKKRGLHLGDSGAE